jgi:hypothetical protein
MDPCNIRHGMPHRAAKFFDWRRQVPNLEMQSPFRDLALSKGITTKKAKPTTIPIWVTRANVKVYGYSKLLSQL